MQYKFFYILFTKMHNFHMYFMKPMFSWHKIGQKKWIWIQKDQRNSSQNENQEKLKGTAFPQPCTVGLKNTRIV